MTLPDWRALAVLSVTDPAEAARRLMALRLSRDALWSAFALVAVLNTLIYTLSGILLPGPSPFPEVLNVPTVYLAIAAGGLLISIYAIYWFGRMFGGTGTPSDVMVLLVWLQALRVAVQAAVLVLVLTIPMLAILLLIGTFVVGVYILLHFIDQALRLGSLSRAAGVLISAFFAIALGLALFLYMTGGPTVGTDLNV